MRGELVQELLGFARGALLGFARGALLGFARSTITVAPSGRHHNSTVGATVSR